MWPEALPPFIIIITMITATGAGMRLLDRWEHKGKPRRYGLSEWDVQMMKRDKRITGLEDVQKAL